MHKNLIVIALMGGLSAPAIGGSAPSGRIMRDMEGRWMFAP